MAILIAILEEYVLLFNRKKFTTSSEKTLNQRELFNEVELTVVERKKTTRRQ